MYSVWAQLNCQMCYVNPISLFAYFALSPSFYLNVTNKPASVFNNFGFSFHRNGSDSLALRQYFSYRKYQTIRPHISFYVKWVNHKIQTFSGVEVNKSRLSFNQCNCNGSIIQSDTNINWLIVTGQWYSMVRDLSYRRGCCGTPVSLFYHLSSPAHHSFW